MAGSLIASLAVLKANWDAGRDYIGNFVPFAAECLRTASKEELSLTEIQACVSSEFGLNIPQGALRTILGRAQKHGYATWTGETYRRNRAELDQLDFPKTRAEVLRKYEGLLDKLAAFCKTRFDVAWSSTEAEGALFSYLEEGSSAILKTVVTGGLISPPSTGAQHPDFMVASFVAELDRADPEGFDFLEAIVKGSMLASALLYPNLAEVGRRFESLEVYFDTAFLLQALGLEGEAREAPCRELLGLLYETGANLAVFEDTVEEIRGVLSVAGTALRSYKHLKYTYGPTIQWLIDSGAAPSDVELLTARLEASLRRLRIRIRRRPPYTKRLGVDEQKLRGVLQEYVGYLRPEALTHDLDALTAIHRLRLGGCHGHMESCKAIFVTTNHRLAAATARFFRDEYPEYRDSPVPHFILDHTFTAIVWLKKPLAAPDLPRKRIIADCYAALNPPDSLWRKYCTEIDRLEARKDITEEDYYVLRLSLPAREALMDVTRGETEALDESAIDEVLKRAKAVVSREAEAPLKELIAQKEDAERRAKAEREAEREAAKREVEAIASRATAAEEQFRSKVLIQRQRVAALAARVGRWLSLAAQFLIAAVVALGICLTLFFPELPFGVWLPVGVALVVFVSVLTVANVVFGTTVSSVFRPIEVRVARYVELKLMGVVGIDADEVGLDHNP
jgi:hypothetical protein